MPLVDISAPAQQVWEALLERDFPAEVRDIVHRPQEGTLRAVDERREEVNAALQHFVEKKLSKSEREKFKASGKYHSFEDVVTHLQDSAERWAMKEGPLVTARTTLLKVLDKLGHFQTLFSIFPSQSAYVSPLAGALKILLMVASNYESSVKEIVDGLLEISEATREVAELSWLFYRDEIQKHIVLFYADILTFCWHALKWYSSDSLKKLIKNARDCGFSKNMTKAMLDIRRDTENIRRLSNNSSMAEIRAMHMQVSNLTQSNCVLQDTLEGVCGDLKQVSENQQLIMQGLVKGLQEMKMQLWTSHWRLTVERLREGRGRIEPAGKFKKQPLPIMAREDDTQSEEISEEEPSVHQHNLSEVIKLLRKATGLTCYSATKDLEAVTRKPTTSGRCHPSDRPRSWIDLQKSQLLWLQGTGTPSRGIDSALAQYAAKIISSAEYAGIPIVHYFCKRSFDSDSDSEDCDRVCTLINSLSLQILLLFKEKVLETDLDLSKKRFKQLSTSDEFDKAWKFFKELAHLQPSLTIVIHCLEYYEEYPVAMRLMRRLNRLVDRGGERVFKVLLTSKRRTTTLRKKLPKDDVVSFKITGHGRGRKMNQRRHRARVRPSKGDESSTASSEGDGESGSEGGESDSEDPEVESEESK